MTTATYLVSRSYNRSLVKRTEGRATTRRQHRAMPDREHYCLGREGTRASKAARARTRTRTRPPAGALQAAALAEVLAATEYVASTHGDVSCIVFFATGDDVALAPSIPRRSSRCAEADRPPPAGAWVWGGGQAWLWQRRA